MKQKSLSQGHQHSAADLLLMHSVGGGDEEHKQGDKGDLNKMVNSLKSGFGSFMSVFGDQKSKK
jgi:hypothetical protein